ncbi:MaoC/PaaZ C-terminal domain-containing protein [Niveispirillum sp. KHB5.9]|uniref:MaoC/PaaZ C-terminal domain-containing protein n=1 Tax=Niveispirillum sp. KHB5.9 TaxID=3400269 RepID=UPI003A846029
MAWRFWEDIMVGERTESRALTVTAAAMKEFADKYDPQYFHTDIELAAQSPFGALIASGLYNCALWRLLDHEENGDIAWVCGIAWDDVRWAAPLRAGDRVRARSHVLSKRASSKRDDAGIVTIHHELVNQDDAVVIRFDSTSFVRTRATGSPAPDPTPSPSRTFPEGGA